MDQIFRLSVLLPFVIFAYFRQRKLIRGRLFEYLFTAFIVLALISYPLADALYSELRSNWAKYPLMLGFYCFPFILYLVLAVLACDLIVALLRKLNRISSETLGTRSWRAVQFWSPIIVSMSIICAGTIHNDRLEISNYAIDAPRKCSNLRQLKMVFASDLHLGRYTEDDLLERFVEKVNGLSPDILLIGGDVLDGVPPDARAGQFEKQFRRIRTKYGTYASPGNHDLRGGDSVGFFERSGISLLRDSMEKIDGAFYLVGRDDPHYKVRNPIEDVLKNATENLPIVLMDHRPIELDRTSRTRVDILLSGHTHDWQFFPLNLVPSRQFELSWGYVRKLKTHIIVSSGVHLSRPPVRTVGLSEIVLVSVTFHDNAPPDPCSPRKD